MPTYNSGVQTVYNGQTTTHDTDSVAENIAISNAEIRWRGQNETGTTGGEEVEWVTFNPNEPDPDAIVSEEFDVENFDESITDEHFVDHELRIDFDLEAEGELYLDQWYVVGPDNEPIDSSTEDETLSWSSADITGRVTIWSGGTLLKNSNGDAGQAYVDFDPDKSTVNYDNVTFEVWTYWDDTETYTYHTTDPLVKNDVDASYSGQLNQDEWSPWVPLSGLEAGINEFDHEIGSSNKADFEFRYDYDASFPNPVHEWRFWHYDGSTWRKHKVALADPSDSKLEYSFFQFWVQAPDGTWRKVAMDLVDPSNEHAVNAKRWDTHNGTLRPRAFETIEY